MLYRHNVSVIIYNKTGKILLVKKRRLIDTWQLPQGGVDQNENEKSALKREVFEELDINDLSNFRSTQAIYQYDFDNGAIQYSDHLYRGQRISFWTAQYFSNKPIKPDQKEIIAYKWVDLSDLNKYIKRPKYLELIQSLS